MIPACTKPHKVQEPVTIDDEPYMSTPHMQDPGAYKVKNKCYKTSDDSPIKCPESLQ